MIYYENALQMIYNENALQMIYYENVLQMIYNENATKNYTTRLCFHLIFSKCDG